MKRGVLAFLEFMKQLLEVKKVVSKLHWFRWNE